MNSIPVDTTHPRLRRSRPAQAVPSASELAASLEVAPARWLDLAHARLPYWRFGTGPDLVFVHGWPLDARTWRGIAPALAEHFTCHLIDLPRAGRAETTRETPHGLDFLADALEEAVEAMDLGDRFGFVGHDSGGGFARMVAGRMPERVAGMVLGNTEIPGFHAWRFKALMAIAKRKQARGLFPLVLGSRAGRWLLLRDCVRDTGLIETELAPRFIAPLLASRRRLVDAMGMALGASVADFDRVGDAHPSIVGPVRLIWGADDPWFRIGPARAMMSTFGGECTMREVAGRKLFVHEEEPALFVEEIEQHFSRCFDTESAEGTR